MGGDNNFGWKVSWDVNPDLSCLTLDLRRKSGTWVKPLCIGGVQALPLPCPLRHGLSLTTRKKRG